MVPSKVCSAKDLIFQAKYEEMYPAQLPRKDVSCIGGHTELHPDKNTVRRNWIEKILLRMKVTHKVMDAITISYGAFDCLNILRWPGRILACDIDPGVRHAINHLRVGHDGKERGNYPDLNIFPAGGDIASTVYDYCRTYGTYQLGVVDVDLAGNIKSVTPILKLVLEVLVHYKYRGTTLLTFVNGRDKFGKDSTSKRIAFLRKSLPKGVRITKVTPYKSGSTGKHAKRSIGSAMCIVELTHS